MNPPLPEPQPATDGQRELTAQERADELIAAVNAAMPTVPLSVRVDPLPSTNPPPTPQPGSPAMTVRETQIGRLALYIGAGISMPILASSVFLVATERANPAVIAWCAGGVGALAALIASLGFVVKRVLSAAPPQNTVTYTGTVYQSETHNETTVDNINKWGGKSSTNVSNQETQ